MGTQQPAELEIAKKIDDEARVEPIGYEGGEVEEIEIDHEYLGKPKSVKFFRSVLFQMLMFGTLSFVGPSIADAISNLGGGGLKNPDLANLAQSLNYAGTCIMTMFGGPVINKLGIKWACMFNAATFFMSGTGFFVNIRYGVEWWLIVAKIITGFTNGFLYVAEAAAMMTYPQVHERGKYLSIWSAMRNSGSVLGGAVSVATNYKSSGAGSVNLVTYIVFIAIESSGPIWALLLSQTRHVRRIDGSKVPMSPNMSWKKEFQALWVHVQHRRTWMMALPSFYSFFFLAIFSTYLATHFSVRARALSSFLAPLTAVLTTLLYGRFLDNKRLSVRARAFFGAIIWVIPNVTAIVWAAVIWNHYPERVALDYSLEPGAWAAAYFPYLIMFASGYWCQVYLYWILSTFSTDVKAASRMGGLFRAFETAGQTTAFAACSKAFRARYMLYTNGALLVPALVSLYFLCQLMPDVPVTIDDVVGDSDRDVKRVEGEALDRKL